MPLQIPINFAYLFMHILKNVTQIALMHVYVRLANFTTTPRFQSAGLQIIFITNKIPKQQK